MDLLGAGQRLWTPRRNFGGGPLQLNKSHWAYPFLIAAIGPSDGSGKPRIFRGPAAPSTFPTAFTSNNAYPSATGEYGAAISFPGSGAQDVATGNQDVFGGLVNYSFVGAFQPTAANDPNDDVVRKDGEFTPIQFGGSASELRCGNWPSPVTTNTYPLAVATNDIVHCGATIAATSLQLYQSVNRGAISTAGYSITTTIPTGVTTTPLCLGGNGAGGELFQGNLFFAYFFKVTLTADQVAQLFLDPAALFVPAEPELPALFAAAAAASAPFARADFVKPFFPRGLPDISRQFNPNLQKNPVPNNQYDWSKPFRVPRLPPDRSVSLNPNLQKNNVPFNQRDWEKRVRVPHITPDGSLSLNPNLVPDAMPCNQYDWSPARRVPDFQPDASLSLNPNLFTNPVPFSTELLRSQPLRGSPDPSQPYNAALYEVTVEALPFNQTDWSTSRRIVGEAQIPDGLNINLLTNPVPFNQVYWPSSFFPRVFAQPPVGFNPNLDPKPFVNQGPTLNVQRSLPDDIPQPYNPNLYSVVAASPFSQSDFARPFFPRGLEPSADSLNINLFTNEMPFSQFDWSKPQQIRITQPQPSSGLNINLFTNPLPVANLSLGAPFAVRAQPSPDQAYNPNLYGVVTVEALPFNQSDVAKPFLPRALLQPSDSLNINLFTNPVPLNQSDWAKPQQIRVTQPQPQAGLNINLFTNPLPFNQTDWSRPPNRFTQPFPQVGLNINLFTNPVPFAAADSGARRVASLTPPDQPYNAALYSVTVAADQPFSQTNLPLVRRPLPAAALSDPLNPNLFRNDMPAVSTDQPLPMRLRAAIDPAQPLNLNLFGIFVPLNQFDFAVAVRPRPNAAPPSAFNPNLQTNPVPFNQFDHAPAHRVPVAPLDLSRGQPNPNIFTNPMPFSQADVGIARLLRGARPFDAINVALLGTPVVAPTLPFNQYHFTPATKPQPQRRQDLLNPTLIASFVPPPPSAEQHSKPFFVTPGRLMNI